MNEGRGERATVVMATILLALKFIWRLMPTDEAPSSTLNALSILLELGMLVGVVGMVPRILRSLPEGAPRGGWIFLLVVAIVSGVGIFGIRLSGGPRVELPPRTSSTSTAAKGLPKQMHEELRALAKLSEKAAANRWLKIYATQDPAQARTLTRQDLQEEREVFRQMLEGADRILNVFAQATSQGIAHSTLSSEAVATRPETWRAAREGYSAAYDYLGLIEQHWDEWLANPFPADEADLKPWQREVQRLTGVTAAASKQFDTAAESKTAPAVVSSEAAALSKQLQECIDSWGKLNEKALTMRWVTLKKDPAKKRTRTRQDLQEMREIYSQLHELIGRALKVLAEAQSKGIDLSTGQSEKYLGRPDFWRAMQRAYDATSENFGLFDQHWDEWLAEVDPPDEKDLKPWQRERNRHDEAIATALKQAKESMAAPVTSAPAPSPPGANFRQLLKQTRTTGDAPSAPNLPAPAPSPPGDNFDQLALQTHMLPAVGDYVIALKRVQATRWIKSPNANSYHPQKITRADLHDANEKLRNLIASIDKLRADLEAVTVPVPAAEKEYWRVKRETSVAFQQLTSLLEENWKEWHVSGIEPKTGEAKPWQKEASRLQGEVDKLKQIEQSSILL